MKVAGIVILFALLAVGVVSCEVSVWQECRIDHSWYYCMRVLNK